MPPKLYGDAGSGFSRAYLRQILSRGTTDHWRSKRNLGCRYRALSLPSDCRSPWRRDLVRGRVGQPFRLADRNLRYLALRPRGVLGHGRATAADDVQRARALYETVFGWRYEPWRGLFYPKGLPHARELFRQGRGDRDEPLVFEP